MDLKSKVVLVNGGGSELGIKIAENFCRAGASVVIAETDALAGALAADQLEQIGEVHFLDIDLTCEASTKAVVERCISLYGRLDWLVNCTTNRWSGPLDELPLDDFRRVVDENLTGAYLMTRHCASHLRSSSGAIVNVAAVSGPVAGNEAYRSSKSALVGLTEALAESLEGEISVYCISTEKGGEPDAELLSEKVKQLCIDLQAAPSGSNIVVPACELAR